MEITVYQFTKRANSTKQPQLNSGVNYDILLKEGTSIYEPSFILSGMSINNLNRNYVKWCDRFYYINDIVQERNGYIRIDCTIDYLATYKDNILNTYAFVLYSTNNADSNIIDDRLSMNRVVKKQTSTSNLFDKGTTYIFSHVGKNNPIMGITDETNFDKMQRYLMDTDVFGTFDKTINGAKDCLTSAILLPIQFSGTSWLLNNINLGNKENVGSCLYFTSSNRSQEFNNTVSIPWNYTDFRNKSKFTRIELYLPSYGIFELNADDVQNKNSITIKTSLDIYTGGVSYLIDNRFKLDTNIGSQLIIGKNSYNGAFSAVGGVAATVGGFASGNPIVGFGGIIATANSLQYNLGTTGSNGTISSIEIDFDIHCTVISYDTNVEPSTMYENYGGPCKRVLNLGNCIGYVQTVNANVSINASSDIIEKVNSALNGGVYIE